MMPSKEDLNAIKEKLHDIIKIRKGVGYISHSVKGIESSPCGLYHRWEPKTADNKIEIKHQLVLDCRECSNCGDPLHENNDPIDFIAVVEQSHLVCADCAFAYLKRTRPEPPNIALSQNFSDRVTPFLTPDAFVKYIKTPLIYSSVMEVSPKDEDLPHELYRNACVAHIVEDGNLDDLKLFALLVSEVIQTYDVIGCLAPIHSVKLHTLDNVHKQLLIWYPFITDFGQIKSVVFAATEEAMRSVRSGDPHCFSDMLKYDHKKGGFLSHAMPEPEVETLDLHKQIEYPKISCPQCGKAVDIRHTWEYPFHGYTTCGECNTCVYYSSTNYPELYVVDPPIEK